MIYKKIDETKKAKLLKNLGTVYAIKTSKGYAIGQIADIEERLGLYICRIFSKLYDNIPTEVEDIVEKKEDYILIVNLPSMAHWRIKQAIVIGKYAIPSNYETPKYTKCNTTTPYQLRRRPPRGVGPVRRHQRRGLRGLHRTADRRTAPPHGTGRSRLGTQSRRRPPHSPGLGSQTP